MFADQRHSVRPDHSEVVLIAPTICARACRAWRPIEEPCRSWAGALRQLRRLTRRKAKLRIRSSILTFRIVGGTSGCEKYFLSKDNWFLDEAFGNEREIIREPGVDPAFERTNPGDYFGSQL